MKVNSVNQTLTSHSEFMADRYLTLDGEWSESWWQFFQRAENAHFWMMKRNISTDGTHIIVNCPLDELQTQITHINSYCATADKDLLAWEHENSRMQEYELKKAAERQAKANEVFSNLKF
ncbi:hypothetical protein [Tatumella citrea]|uniref:Uncharacterized protein n=1 Tax=Tatumella citrea TaxID=53336 RepID=A0A1Y0LLQ4_TATCI|nr:hypothetical protein [Tatumella citrea]ARU94572.1 hypothetical protein A7K98_12850 [Tatumella citrea]ARU98610.1 hypothetical protein A7K99_12840 [Tatumella citrea]